MIVYYITIIGEIHKARILEAEGDIAYLYDFDDSYVVCKSNRLFPSIRAAEEALRMKVCEVETW